MTSAQASVEAFADGTRTGLRVVIGSEGAHARDTADLTAISLAGVLSPDGARWVDIDRSFWDQGRAAWCSAVYIPTRRSPEQLRQLRAQAAAYLERRGFATTQSAEADGIPDPRPGVVTGQMGLNPTCPITETARLVEHIGNAPEAPRSLLAPPAAPPAPAPRSLLEPRRVTFADLIGHRKSGNGQGLKERPERAEDPADQRYAVFDASGDILGWYRDQTAGVHAMGSTSGSTGVITRDGILLGWRTPYDQSSAQAKNEAERVAHKIVIRWAMERRAKSRVNDARALGGGQTCSSR